MSRRNAARSLRAWAAVIGMVAAAASAVGESPADAAPADIRGSGSSYVAKAMDTWIADVQVEGLSVNYNGLGSPVGLQQFAAEQMDFAGTEAEYSALGENQDPNRGHQYVPDVAGAVGVLYNVVDKSGAKVDFLRLSRRTVARIFMGDIARWSDPAITADNKGIQLPDEAINVVYRQGLSGTTALFYDFVAKTEPQLFARWAATHRLPTSVRIIQLDSASGFAPKTQALAGSDLIAQYLAGNRGRWSIAYDEYAYAKLYGASVARVENEAGNWVLPFAQNISAALESARLRPDLSQELSGVYTSSNPLAYPISAYSYLVTQCASAPDRATCKGKYRNPGVAEALRLFMRYIACRGQVQMATVGFSPLPPHLSQELANSIARMEGTEPEQLSAANCENPRFRGSLGAGSESPPDPLENFTPIANGNGGSATTGGGAAAGAAGGGGATSGGGGAGASGGTAAGPGSDGSTAIDAGATGLALAGGSSRWRDAAPVAYDRPTGVPGFNWPLLVLFVLVATPALVTTLRRSRRDPGTEGRRHTGAGPAGEVSPTLG